MVSQVRPQTVLLGGSLLLSRGKADVEEMRRVRKQELTFCCETDSLPRCGIQERLRPQVRSNYMVLMGEDFAI